MKQMKQFLFAIGLLVALPVWGQTTSADVPPATITKKPELVDFSADLAKVTADLKQKFDGQATNFDDNLKAINALIAQHQKDGNREQVARLYLLDAHIYADGLNNKAKAREFWAVVVHNYPGTLAAKGASLSLSKLNAEAAAVDLSIPEGLEVGQRFPGFSETDVGGRPLSVAAYRGRVTLVDFWATWCGPCKAEMPNVIATYNKYHAQGFDIIGVSLDDDRSKLLAYTQSAGMAWAQFFDGQGWDNKLAKQYNIHSIPMSYLLDRHGVIVGKGLRGARLPAMVETTLVNSGNGNRATKSSIDSIPFVEEK
jgi:thiol-disulfide isomerase/thioredoxin